MGSAAFRQSRRYRRSLCREGRRAQLQPGGNKNIVDKLAADLDATDRGLTAERIRFEVAGVLTIRSAQIAAMEEYMRPDYHDRLVAYFQRKIPEHTVRYQDTALRRLVAESDRKARNYGLITREGIARFVGLSIIIGPRFNEEPNTKLFLSLPELDPERKMELLCRLLARKLESADSSRP